MLASVACNVFKTNDATCVVFVLVVVLTTRSVQSVRPCVLANAMKRTKRRLATARHFFSVVVLWLTRGWAAGCKSDLWPKM